MRGSVEYCILAVFCFLENVYIMLLCCEGNALALNFVRESDSKKYQMEKSISSS